MRVYKAGLLGMLLLTTCDEDPTYEEIIGKVQDKKCVQDAEYHNGKGTTLMKGDSYQINLTDVSYESKPYKNPKELIVSQYLFGEKCNVVKEIPLGSMIKANGTFYYNELNSEELYLSYEYGDWEKIWPIE